MFLYRHDACLHTNTTTERSSFLLVSLIRIRGLSNRNGWFIVSGMRALLRCNNQKDIIDELKQTQ